MFVGLALQAGRLQAHGNLENSRMIRVRVAGPNGTLPAPWNESYYTWNQDSNNFPGYASTGFKYSTTVPDGTIASAGINDGVHTGLNFSGLNNPSDRWPTTAATAGSAVSLHWLATALHDPSHFQVYLTRAGANTASGTLAWADLDFLGAWSVGSTTRPVTTSTRPNPVSGGTIPSYDWTVPIPADRAGHVILVVIWQRDDPAGEAFFAVQDFLVAGAPTLAVSMASGGVTNLDLRGTPGQAYDLQATDDLAHPSWATLATGTADSSGRWFTSDPGAATRPRRFYRAQPHL